MTVTQRIIVKAIICVFITAFIWVISRTVYSPPPVSPADTVIFVSHETHAHYIMEVRKIIGYTAGDNITVTRFFYEEANPKNFFQVNGGDFRTMEGEFPLLHTTLLPSWVTGRWCSRITLGWWPSWSQRAFSMQPKDVCFETSEYE